MKIDDTAPNQKVAEGGRQPAASSKKPSMAHFWPKPDWAHCYRTVIGRTSDQNKADVTVKSAFVVRRHLASRFRKGLVTLSDPDEAASVSYGLPMWYAFDTCLEYVGHLRPKLNSHYDGLFDELFGDTCLLTLAQECEKAHIKDVLTDGEIELGVSEMRSGQSQREPKRKWSMDVLDKLERFRSRPHCAEIVHQRATKALKFGDMLEGFPDTIGAIIRERTWEYRSCKRLGGKPFPDLLSYVTHHEPDGMGTTVERVEELIFADPEVSLAWQNETGRPPYVPPPPQLETVLHLFKRLSGENQAEFFEAIQKLRAGK